MRNRALVEKVQELYQSGSRVSTISKELNLPSWNVSRWGRKVNDISIITDKSTRQEIDRYRWYTYDKIKLSRLDQKSSRQFISLLYWCEGCKYPGTNKVEFVSSDEKMQATFIKLMRIAFNKELDESKFRVMLQLHTTHNIEDAINHWSSVLHLPATQFVKPHITKSSANRYRHIYNDTCSLRYFDYRILLRIMGSYDQISHQIIND